MRYSLGGSIAMLAFAAGAALAHHSGATYFVQDSPVTHKNAVVVSFTMINPHSRLVFTVIDENGEKAEWTAETQSHTQAASTQASDGSAAADKADRTGCGP